MPAYMIFTREEPVHDAEAMARYQGLVQKSVAGHPMKPLVVYGATEGVEGDTPDGVVVLEFPSVEDAKAWYHSPGYQAALPHRMQAARYRAFIVQGL